MESFFITIHQGLVDQMVRHCEARLPNEACGFLTGVRHSDQHFGVHSFIPISNSSKNPRIRFEMDPLEVSSTLTRLQKPEQLIGIVHSHPLAEAIPSDTDLITLWHTVPSHWIISFKNLSTPEVRAYSYLREHGQLPQFIPLHLKILK